MDYQKIYDDFIRDRRADESRLKDSDECMERHHIKPKSLGGDDSEENLICLNHRDHYFAHCCLAKIHGGVMWLALEMMSNWVSKTNGRSFAFTQSKLAAIARQKYWEENIKWPKEACITDAAKYETKIQWDKASPYAYRKALDCGWIEECSAHMKSNKGRCQKKAVINLTTGDSFDSLRAAAKQFKLNENAIGNVLAGRAKKCGGFEWKYA